MSATANPAAPASPTSAFAIGKKLVALCQQGKNLEAIQTLYAPNVVSIEAMAMPGNPTRLEGLDAIVKKSKEFAANSTIHSSSVEGPWPHGDRFIVTFSIDMTAKAGPMAGQRMQMKEAALFTVKNGKVTQEEFFYPGCEQ
jgi:ketosteroid isomerase-like protein